MKECQCPELKYIVSQVSEGSDSRPGQLEHLYQCGLCGWVTKFDEYMGERIDRRNK